MATQCSLKLIVKDRFKDVLSYSQNTVSRLQRSVWSEFMWFLVTSVKLIFIARFDIRI